MGNSTVDQLQQKIAALQLQLQAQIAKCSQLQARLSSALDAMETLQYTHTREIAAERETKTLMNTKLNGLAEYTQKIEEERDELQEAVLALIEKVEVSNDYSLWPYSRVRLPHSLAPSQDIPQRRNVCATSTDPQDYGPSIMNALRAELEKERLSHAKTHDSAEFEIACLRAQLARRDAELQACVAHVDHGALLSGMHGHEAKPPDKRLSPDYLAPEETAHILGLTNSTNRELEVETRRLLTQLGKSRSTPAAPDEKRMIRHRSKPSSIHEERPSSVHAPSPVADPVVYHSSSPSPPSPNLPPYFRHDSPSPYTMTPRIPGTPNRSSNHTEAHHSGPHAHSHPSTSTSMADFGDEIQRLGREIELLHQRREKWQGKLTTQSEESTAETVVAALRKEEAVQVSSDHRERDELAALRSEFEVFKLKTTRRESAFAAEILELRCALAERPTEMTSPGETDTLVALVSPLTSKHEKVPSARERHRPHDAVANVTILPFPSRTESTPDDHAALDALLGSGTGTEQSMELGTPLRPSVILTEGDTIVMTNESPPFQPSAFIDFAQINPLLIPLPDSPMSSPCATTSPIPLPTADSARAAAIRDRPPTPFKFMSSSPSHIVEERDVETSRDAPALRERVDAAEESGLDISERIQEANKNAAINLRSTVNEEPFSGPDSGAKGLAQTST